MVRVYYFTFLFIPPSPILPFLSHSLPTYLFPHIPSLPYFLPLYSSNLRVGVLIHILSVPQNIGEGTRTRPLTPDELENTTLRVSLHRNVDLLSLVG